MKLVGPKKSDAAEVVYALALFIIGYVLLVLLLCAN
jgi:hypothetical protein